MMPSKINIGKGPITVFYLTKPGGIVDDLIGYNNQEEQYLLGSKMPPIY